MSVRVCLISKDCFAFMTEILIGSCIMMFMAEQSGKALTAQNFVMNVSNVRHVARMSSFFIIKFQKKKKNVVLLVRGV